MLFLLRAALISLVSAVFIAGGPAQAASFKKLHDFTGADGTNPILSLIDPSGNIYGGTSGGPDSIFRIAPDGTFTLLGYLGGQFTGGMSRADDGNLYTTDWFGNFYKISPGGGVSQTAHVTMGISLGYCNDAGGNFFAISLWDHQVVAVSPQGSTVTSYGLAYIPQNSGVSCDAGGNLLGGTGWVDYHAPSTIYQISPQGAVKTLYKFCKGKDPTVDLCGNGVGLNGGPVRDSHGNIFGTTEFGGRDGPCLASDALKGSSGVYIGCGVLYELTAAGELQTLHRFCAKVDPVTQYCNDGAFPQATVIVAPDGTLYSTTAFGGKYDGGTVWKLPPGGKLTVIHNFCAKPDCTDGYYAGTLLMDGTGMLYGATSLGGTYGKGTLFKLVP